MSQVRRQTNSKAAAKSPSNLWIRTLAAPYLRGYRPVIAARGALRGYRFFAPGASGTRARRGFFVGYLSDPANHEFLQPQPPECLVFAFVEPVNSAAFRRLVSAEDSLLRQTAKYIPWLTHRRPRFAFFEDQEVVLVRHSPMQDWPPEKHQHFSGNFFIETLAWLVRSGLVGKLGSESREERSKVRSIPRKK